MLLKRRLAPHQQQSGHSRYIAPFNRGDQPQRAGQLLVAEPQQRGVAVVGLNHAPQTHELQRVEIYL